MRGGRIAAAVTAIVACGAVLLAGCSAQPNAAETSVPPASGANSPATGTTPRPTVHLNVGYIDTSINGVGLTEVANHLGLWKKAGIDVKLTPFTNGPTQIQAMAAGSLDIGYIGGGATWMPATGQAVIVAPSESTYGDFLIASPKSGAKTVADIKGLKVGVPDGGSGEMILNLALEKAGLTPNDITRVPLDPPAVVSAFVAGQIDVAAIFSPLSDQIMQSVPNAVKIANNKDFPETVFLGAWVASNQAIQQHPDAVERFLEVYAQANDYRIAHHDDTVNWASAASGAPAAQLQGQVDALQWSPSDQIVKDNADGTTAQRYTNLQALFIKLGRMKQEQSHPIDQWLNTDLFAQAVKTVEAGQ